MFEENTAAKVFSCVKSSLNCLEFVKTGHMLSTTYLLLMFVLLMVQEIIYFLITILEKLNTILGTNSYRGY